MGCAFAAGHTMEGTRLTIVRVPTQPDAYEFSIRTPVTPPRWKDFEQVTNCQLLSLAFQLHHMCPVLEVQGSVLGGVSIL